MPCEDRQRPRDQIVIAAHGHARPADEKRDRPHPFMGVRLDLLLRAEHGDGPVAEVVVQLGNAAADDAVGLLPRPALLQHGLADPADKERLEQRFVRLVEQQVAMELAIAGQGFFEDQSEHRLGLIDLAESVALTVELLQGFGQTAVDRLPRRLDAVGRGVQHLEEVVEVL